MSKLKETLNTSQPKINFAVWCETCEDYKTEFEVDESGLWILCQDCNEGLIKVIK